MAACSSSNPPAPASSPSPQIMVRLSHLPDGVATLGVDAQAQRLRVHIDVYGLAPKSTAAVRLRPGSCLAPGATSMVSFPVQTADARGALRTDAVSDQAVPGGIPQHATIDLEAPGDAAQAAEPVAAPALLACTDIPTVNPTAPLRLFAPPQLKPAGSATLEYDRGPGTISVHLTALGLPPGESYTAEIRMGSCAAQGAVVSRIAGVTPDAKGTVATTVTLHNAAAPPATGWYVAVRRTSPDLGGGNGGAAAAGPLLCGDVHG